MAVYLQGLLEDDEKTAEGKMSVPALPIEYFDDSEACRALWVEVLILAVDEWKWLHGKGTLSGCIDRWEPRERLKARLRAFFFRPNDAFDTAVGACRWVRIVNGQRHVFELNKQAFREAIRRIEK